MNFDHVDQKITHPSGGSIELSGITVPANSPGNMSRWVTQTAGATPTENGYWSNLITFTTTADNYRRSTFVYELHARGGSSNSIMRFSVHLNQETAGLSTGSSVQVISITTSTLTGAPLNYDSVKLVGSSVAGNNANLWVKHTDSYASYHLYELTSVPGTQWVPTYNYLQGWQTPEPTGDVNILSNYHGSAGVVESGSNANGYYIKLADGTILMRIVSTTGTAGNKTFTLPATVVATADLVFTGTLVSTSTSDLTVKRGGATTSSITAYFTSNGAAMTSDISITFNIQGRWK